MALISVEVKFFCRRHRNPNRSQLVKHRSAVTVIVNLFEDGCPQHLGGARTYPISPRVRIRAAKFQLKCTAFRVRWTHQVRTDPLPCLFSAGSLQKPASDSVPQSARAQVNTDPNTVRPADGIAVADDADRNGVTKMTVCASAARTTRSS